MTPEMLQNFESVITSYSAHQNAKFKYKQSEIMKKKNEGIAYLVSIERH